MFYNYRFHRTLSSEILERLKNDGEISQGWGGGRDGNLDLNEAGFVHKCAQYYGLATTRVPSNLTRIRDLSADDVLVVPHLPDNGKVSLHVVSGDFPSCYRYEANDDNHQNHRIKISESFGLDGGLSVRNVRFQAWYAKLQWLRLPVIALPQFETEFSQVITDLRGNPSGLFERTGFADYMELLRGNVIEQLKRQLQDVRPSGTEVSFEAICKSLLQASGYRVVSQNQYDREGGDIDLHCVRDRSDASPFEGGEVNLFVQVKKHSGKTDKHSVEQLLRMMAENPMAEGCVMSLADSYTEEAQQMARDNGILLMPGEAICQLLLEELGQSRVG